MSRIYEHKNPSNRVLDNPYTNNVSYNPIFFVDELAAASHCPRKARLLKYEANYHEYCSKDRDYYQHFSTSGTPTSWHNGSIYKHFIGYEYLIKQSLMRIKNNPSLASANPNTNTWSNYWRDIYIRKFGTYISNSLSEDVFNFFSRWFTNNRIKELSDQNFDINFRVFNPNTSFPIMTVPEVGKITPSGLPIIGIIDLINYDTNTITKIMCHHDNWIVDDIRLYDNTGVLARSSTNINFNDQRTYEMLFSEAENQLVIFREMLNSYNYNRTASYFDDYDQNRIYLENQAFISTPLLDFKLEISTINRDFIVDPPILKIISGIFSITYASRGRMSLLNNLDGVPTNNPNNPCFDPGFNNGNVGIRDQICNYKRSCYNTRKRYIPNMLIFNEITSFHKDLWAEDKIKTCLPWYRIHSMLYRNSSLILNSLHGLIYVGEIINNSQDGSIVKLLEGYNSSSLVRGNEYQFAEYSNLFGPFQEIKLKEFESDMLEFETILPLVNDTYIVFIPKIDPFRNLPLINRMIANLKSKIPVNNIPDSNNPTFVQEFIMREALIGGKRAAQSTFGGWGDFL